MSELSEKLQGSMEQAAVNLGLVPQKALERVKEIQARLLTLQAKDKTIVNTPIDDTKAVMLDPHWMQQANDDEEWPRWKEALGITEEDLRIAREKIAKEGDLFIGDAKKPTSGEIAYWELRELSADVQEAIECAQVAAEIEKTWRNMQNDEVGEKPAEEVKRNEERSAISRIPALSTAKELKEARTTLVKAERLHNQYKTDNSMRIGTNSALKRAEIWKESAEAWQGAAALMQKAGRYLPDRHAEIRPKLTELSKSFRQQGKTIQEEVKVRVKILNSIPSLTNKVPGARRG